jgi:hypothetical protein
VTRDFGTIFVATGALDGRTSADLAGIKVQGENKWLALI